MIAAFCKNPQVLAGYGLGLAYWLDHMDGNPRLLREFFGKLTTETGKSGPAMVALMESLAPGRLRATELEVKRAAATLPRHGR